MLMVLEFILAIAAIIIIGTHVYVEYNAKEKIDKDDDGNYIV